MWWCGRCAKCLSIYTQLYPFVSDAQIRGIFGEDLFARADLVPLARSLAGLTETRPLECVGAIDETLAAFYLSLVRASAGGRTSLPPVLAWFAEEVSPRHPELAATASRELARRKGRYALATMCIGVGQGIALAVERV